MRIFLVAPLHKKSQFYTQIPTCKLQFSGKFGKIAECGNALLKNAAEWQHWPPFTEPTVPVMRRLVSAAGAHGRLGNDAMELIAVSQRVKVVIVVNIVVTKTLRKRASQQPQGFSAIILVPR